MRLRISHLTTYRYEQPGDYTIHVGRSSRDLQAVGAITAV